MVFTPELFNRAQIASELYSLEELEDIEFKLYELTKVWRPSEIESQIDVIHLAIKEKRRLENETNN